jgi:hypothetical protein
MQDSKWEEPSEASVGVGALVQGSLGLTIIHRRGLHDAAFQNHSVQLIPIIRVCSKSQRWRRLGRVSRCLLQFRYLTLSKTILLKFQ